VEDTMFSDEKLQWNEGRWYFVSGEFCVIISSIIKIMQFTLVEHVLCGGSRADDYFLVFFVSHIYWKEDEVVIMI